MRTLPSQRLRLHHRLCHILVIGCWLVVALIALSNVIASFSEGGYTRATVQLFITGVLLYQIGRLNGAAYGPGIIWLVLMIAMTIEEIAALPPVERADTELLAVVWGIVGLLAVNALVMAYLKAGLFPHAPWLPLRVGRIPENEGSTPPESNPPPGVVDR